MLFRPIHLSIARSYSLVHSRQKSSCCALSLVSLSVDTAVALAPERVADSCGVTTGLMVQLINHFNFWRRSIVLIELETDRVDHTIGNLEG